jgi:hypothetical protein
MHNDSIETLLLRHYGHTAPTPPALEQRLIASVRTQAAELRQQQHIATRIRNKRISRRRVIGLVALSSAGLGLLSVGLEILQTLEANLIGRDVSQTQSAFS